MLRVSMQQTQRDIDIQVINGQKDGSMQVAFADELATFAEAVASFDQNSLSKAREELLKAGGEKVLVDAAGVAANFQRMVRIADSMGIPVDQPTENELSNHVRKELNLYRFRSSKNTTNAV